MQLFMIARPRRASIQTCLYTAKFGLSGNPNGLLRISKFVRRLLMIINANGKITENAAAHRNKYAKNCADRS